MLISEMLSKVVCTIQVGSDVNLHFTGHYQNLLVNQICTHAKKMYWHTHNYDKIAFEIIRMVVIKCFFFFTEVRFRNSQITLTKFPLLPPPKKKKNCDFYTNVGTANDCMLSLHSCLTYF